MGNLQKNIISGCKKCSKGNRSGDRINSDLGWGYCLMLGGLRGPLWGGDMWAEYWRMRTSHHGEREQQMQRLRGGKRSGKSKDQKWGKCVWGLGNSECGGNGDTELPYELLSGTERGGNSGVWFLQPQWGFWVLNPFFHFLVHSHYQGRGEFPHDHPNFLLTFHHYWSPYSLASYCLWHYSWFNRS